MIILICLFLAAGILANLMFTCFLSKHFDRELADLESKILSDLIDAVNTLDKADEELDKRIEKLECPKSKPIPIFPSIPPIEC